MHQGAPCTASWQHKRVATMKQKYLCIPVLLVHGKHVDNLVLKLWVDKYSEKYPEYVELQTNARTCPRKRSSHRGKVRFIAITYGSYCAGICQT